MPRLSGGDWVTSDDIPLRTAASVRHFLSLRDFVIQQIRDNIASAQAQQARNTNHTSRKNMNIFHIKEIVYLHNSAVPPAILGNSKLQRPWIGPFANKEKISDTAYRLDLPPDWQIHPTFYVGKLKRHVPCCSFNRWIQSIDDHVWVQSYQLSTCPFAIITSSAPESALVAIVHTPFNVTSR